VPYGSSQEYGLYFVAFSAERSRYERMLDRMFGTAPDGLHDRLTDFSRPVSGAYYFAPSLNALNDLANSFGIGSRSELGRAATSSRRERIPSLPNTLRRW
jgi:deferrochelatase/peroxidase EfeB